MQRQSDHAARPAKSSERAEPPKKQFTPPQQDALAHARRFRPPPRRFLRKLSGKR
jgi:hypothetical protein